VAWIAINFDRRKTVNEELTKKRLVVYDDMVPKANDQLCYITCVGCWKTFNPEKLLNHKREFDRSLYINGPLFSQDLIRYGHRFIFACFITFTGAGKPAKLRADKLYLETQWQQDWDHTWDSFFVGPSEIIKDKELREAYNAFVDQFAIEIGARQSKHRKKFRIF